jgi:hypothetical protein
MVSRSRKSLSVARKALREKIEIYEQRVLDTEVMAARGVPEVAQKQAFIRQELAKLRRGMRDLNRGTQSWWASQGLKKEQRKQPVVVSKDKKLFRPEIFKENA